MKKTLILSIVLIILCLCACRYNRNIDLQAETILTQPAYVENTTFGEYETIQQTTASVNVAPESTQLSPVDETLTASGDTNKADESQTVTLLSETSTHTIAQTEPTSTNTQSGDEVDISIELPSANGNMVLEKNADNRFIQLVAKQRGIDTELLWAVFSVPESGQNYVFEFYDENKRDADGLRRVYLIDESGAIVGVSASKSAEKEQIGSIENWFCMNVLIKQIIFPEITKD